jgi:hypothetical protein
MVVVVCGSLASAFGVGTATGSPAATVVRIRLPVPRASADTAPIGLFSIHSMTADVRESFSQACQAPNGVPEVAGSLSPTGPIGLSDALLEGFVLMGLPDVN